MKSKATRIRQLSIGFLVVFGLTWTLIYSCEKDPVQPVKPYYNSKNINPEKDIRLISSLGKLGERSDPYRIKKLDVRGNFLYMEIEYAGGCNNHEFKLIGTRDIEKSLPPNRAIEFIHDANKDNCRALIRTNFIIDLRPLAYAQEKGSEIYFLLDGWDRKIYYQYVVE